MTRTATSLVRVNDSGIHGKGLFASRDIPADTLILRVEGDVTTVDGPHVLWWEDDDGAHGIRITSAARYVNHARPPNAAFYDLELWSLRDIRKGEEISHDYGPDWDATDA